MASTRSLLWCEPRPAALLYPEARRMQAVPAATQRRLPRKAVSLLPQSRALCERLECRDHDDAFPFLAHRLGGFDARIAWISAANVAEPGVMTRKDPAASNVHDEISPAVCPGLGDRNRRSGHRDSRHQSEPPVDFGEDEGVATAGPTHARSGEVDDPLGDLVVVEVRLRGEIVHGPPLVAEKLLQRGFQRWGPLCFCLHAPSPRDPDDERP